MKKLLFFCYATFLLLFTVFSYAFVDPNLIYMKKIFTGFAFNQREITTVFFIFFVCGLFGFYFLFLKMFSKKKLHQKDFFNLAGITIVALFFSYPAMVSYDIFNYIATAKVTFFYKENPYIVMPIAMLRDPLLLFMHAPNKTALYGPIWILLTSIPFLTGLGNFLVILFSFKLFVVLFYIGTIILLFKMTKNISAIAFFAFNPLVVFETFISSHNDIVMMFFVLLSFYLLQQRKIFSAVFFLVLSFFIKYATVLLFFVLFYEQWKIKKGNQFLIERVSRYSFVAMLILFCLSPIREELYPWYAIWFLIFTPFLFGKNFVTYVSVGLSFGLLLRYIPFMLIGTYFGPTPLLRIILTTIPLICAVVIYFLHNKKFTLW